MTCRQSTLNKMTGFKAKIKSTTEQLTNTVAKWIAVECRALSVQS